MLMWLEILNSRHFIPMFPKISRKQNSISLFRPVRLLISHQPAVLFSHNKPATSNQPAVLFSQNKPAPATSQPNRLFVVSKII
jgi:hypothetical protein